jgi:hypothetical protein
MGHSCTLQGVSPATEEDTYGEESKEGEGKEGQEGSEK